MCVIDINTNACNYKRGSKITLGSGKLHQPTNHICLYNNISIQALFIVLQLIPRTRVYCVVFEYRII